MIMLSNAPERQSVRGQAQLDLSGRCRSILHQGQRLLLTMWRTWVCLLSAVAFVTVMSACSNNGGPDRDDQLVYCSGAQGDLYSKGLAGATGRGAEITEQDQDLFRGLLSVAYLHGFEEAAPKEVRPAASVVVRGAEDAQDGEITDADLTRYLAAFEELTKGESTQC